MERISSNTTEPATNRERLILATRITMNGIVINWSKPTFIRELINRSREGWGRVDISKLVQTCLFGDFRDVVGESVIVYREHCRKTGNPDSFYLIAPLEDQIIREISSYRIAAAAYDISKLECYDESDLDIYDEPPPS